jgi:hypothetical protein
MLCENYPHHRTSYPCIAVVRRGLHGLLGSIRRVDLVRAWVCQLAAASLTALSIPLAIVGALVALTFTGGFGSLGGLGQIVSGPATPPASPARAAAVLPRVAAHAARATAARAATVAAVGAQVVAAPWPAPRPGGATPVTPEPVSNASAPVPAGSPATAGSSRVPASAPAPASRPTVVARVVGVADSVAAKLPAPVGPAAAQAVQSVGSALPPLQSGSAPRVNLP